MIKWIEGSWFEFRHHNKVEGKYWNPVCRHFVPEQWEEKVAEMASLGMKYIVLLCTSLVEEGTGEDDIAESYFQTDIYPLADFACKDPLETLLAAADRYNMKVFVSCGYYGNWLDPQNNMRDLQVQSRAFLAMEQLVSR